MTSPETRPQLEPPGEVARIARRLEDAGFETWCVGGAIRDAILGFHHLDWDLATAAPPARVRRLFRRTIPVGVEFGTVGVLGESGRLYEVTTFRKDVRTDGRHAEVEFGVSLREDLARRDFTINAIAYHPLTHEWCDPFEGRRDIDRKTIRAVGDAAERMREDRLRALRAIRFAARFDFTIESLTWNAIVGSAPALTRLSPERVRQEMEKTMEQVRNPSAAFRLWRESGAFASLVPALSSVNDSVLGALDLLPLPAGSRSRWRRTLRMATLFSELEADEAASALRSLRFPNKDIRWISSLVSAWHRAGQEMGSALTGAGSLPGGVKLRSWAAAIGRLELRDFMRLADARWRAASASCPPPSRVRMLHRNLLSVAWNDPLEIQDLALDGEDLRLAGIPPGPEMGQVLRELLEAVLQDPELNTRERLLRLVRERKGGE